MLRLVMLLRHGEAGRPDGLADRLRPLTAAGRRAAGDVGRFLAARPEAPDLVLVSSAERTRETWACVSDAGLRHGEVSVEPELYAASVETLLGRLQALPESAASVLMVAHNPGLEGLVARLLGPGVPGDGLAPADLVLIASEAATWTELGEKPARLEAFHRPPAVRS